MTTEIKTSFKEKQSAIQGTQQSKSGRMSVDEGKEAV